MFRQSHHPAEPPAYAVCFDPGSLTLLQAVSLAGTAISVVGAIQGGNQAQSQANLQAEIFNREAEQSRLASEADAADFARTERRRQGSLRALIGGSGARTGTGTPLAVEEDRAAEAEFQRLNVLHGGVVTSNRFRTQAGLTRAGGSAARTRSRTTAGARLLKGQVDPARRLGSRRRRPRRRGPGPARRQARDRDRKL